MSHQRLRRNIRRPAFTLFEMLVSLSIMGMIGVVLGSLVLATESAMATSEAEVNAIGEARFAIHRIEQATARAGTYRLTGAETVLGVRVIAESVYFSESPDICVVWSGGRDGDMAALGELDRLPTAEELVVYRAQPSNPAILEEITFPGRTDAVSFTTNDTTFKNTINGLLNSPDAEPLIICDRVRGVEIDVYGTIYHRPCVRYVIVSNPTDSELQSASTNSTAWAELPWRGGVCTPTSGQRTSRVRIELQADRGPAVSGSTDAAIPFFGSGGRVYAYSK